MAHLYRLAALFLCCFVFSAPVFAQNCPITISAGPDKYLCAPPTPTQLEGDIDGKYLNFSWSPTTGMSNPNTLTPTVNVTTSMTYVLTARAVNESINAIVNGDFESGNTGFTSDYVYSPGNLVPEGYYDVIDNPMTDHPGFKPCVDHTSGTGNMMVVNGAGTPNANVWCQTINVMPNSQYAFSCWVNTVVAAAPARLQFEINGATIGPIFNAPSTTCVWQNFYAIWNSGSNTTATICILNQNTTLSGNDFALDDLVFAPICVVTDTVKVNVISVTAKASPPSTLIPCEGANATLSGAGSSTGANITHLWETNDGNIVSGANGLSPVVNAAGTYTLTVTYEKDGHTCTKTASVSVVVTPNPLSAWITPPPPLGCGSPTILLLGNSSQTSNSAWSWVASNGGNIKGSTTTKNVTVDKPGNYTLTVTNTATGCTAVAEVQVLAATNPPVANATTVGSITCTNLSVPLNGAGSTTGTGISYTWTTPDGSIIGSPMALNTTAGKGGTYILAVNNSANGCTAYDTVIVASNTALPMLTTAIPKVLNCKTDTLTLSTTVSPAGVNLLWTTTNGNIVSGATTANPQVTVAGTYTVTATNTINNCTTTATVTAIADYAKPLAGVLPADSITCQQSSVTLSGSGSSTGPRFIYLWTADIGGNIVSGNTTLSPVVNAPATYVLLVTDTVNACTSTASVSVLADQNIVLAVANAPDTLTCSIQSVALNTIGSSNLSTLKYAWTTPDGKITAGADTPTPTVSSAGTYELLLTNTANGCSATDLAVVAIDTVAPKIQIAPTDIITCAHPEQDIHATNLSLPGSFDYLWKADSSGNILADGQTLTPKVNLPGVYVLTVKNLHTGCTATFSTAVGIANDVPIAVAASPGPLTCTAPLQNLSVSVSPSGGNLSYAWQAGSGGHISQGDSTSTPSIDQPGAYHLLITNLSNGCTATSSVTVTENKIAPPAEAGPAATLTCTAPFFDLVANSGQAQNLNFKWSTPNGHFTGNPNSPQIKCDSAGLYRLLVTDPINGCTATDSVQIAANQQLPQLSIELPDTLTCLTKSLVLLSYSTGNSLAFQWQTVDGHFTSSPTADSLIVDRPGTYTLHLTDGVNGCTQTVPVTVFQDIAPPVISISPVGPITCASPLRNITAQNFSLPGNFSYAWTPSAGGNILSGAKSLSISVDKGGDYTLLTTNDANGCTQERVVKIAQDTQLPNAAAGADDTLTCNLQSLTLVGAASSEPGLQFAWTASGGGNILNGANTLTPKIDKPGIYTLLVSNPVNGCTANDVVQIFNDVNTPQANAGTAATLTCTLKQTSLNASASTGPTFSYQWTTSGTGSIVNGASTLKPLVDRPGIYTLSVLNSVNGCVSTSTVSVPEDVTPPVVSAGADATLSCSIQSLSLSGTASGGAVTYSWQASNGGNILSGNNTPAPIVNRTGTYTLIATLNSNGCTASDAAVVKIDTLAPVLSIEPPLLLTCSQKTTALIGMVQQPGAGSFSAAWTTNGGHFAAGQNTLTTSADAPGTYILEIKNTQNGCSKKEQVTVLQDIDPPTAVAGLPGIITCDHPSIALNGAGSSSGSIFIYNWVASGGGQILNGGNTLTPTVGKSGVYTLQVGNSANGCTATASTSVTTDNTLPTLVVAPPATLTCAVKSVTATAVASGGGTNPTFAWGTINGHFVSGQNTLSLEIDAPGIYTLLVTNTQNGCATTTQTSVSQNITPPGAEAGPTHELHCNLPEVALNGSSPVGATAAYAWSVPVGSNGNIASGALSAQPLVDAPGAYQLTVTNTQNGCTSTDVTTVTEVLPPDFQPTLWQPDCIDPTGAVDFGPVTHGKAPFTYSVDGGQTYHNSPAFDNLKINTYSLRVRDAYGCEASKTVDLKPPFTPTVSLPVSTLIELGDSVVLLPTLNQPVGNIVTWQWSPSQWLDCSDCPQPEAKPQRRMVYALKIKDKNGCVAEAKTEIRVNRRRNLYAPNVFSPNGDGLNDRFMLFGKGVVDVRQLAVFDRWGNQMYADEHLPINDQSKGWDGSFRGNPMNPGVFVWQAVVEFVDGEVETYFGDVTIER